MVYGWGGYGYGIDFAEEVGTIGENITLILSGQTFCFFGVYIDHGNEPALRKLVIDLGVYGPHSAGADDGGSYLFRGFFAET
jgi:hypothetical protein